jgi:glucose-1-phosphate thymidylyltransferase
MIYYPIATLMLAGIREFIIVCSPQSLEPMKSLLGSGKQFGIELNYILQDQPLGIAQGFALAKEFARDRKVLAILGDNFFFGPKMGSSLKDLCASATQTTVFLKEVGDVTPFGVATLDDSGVVRSLVEKPQNSKSKLAVTGLYLFQPGDLALVAELEPSTRGELEIVDLLLAIRDRAGLNAEKLSLSTFWSDLGTTSLISKVEQYVNSIEQTQSVHVLVPELIAVEQGWVTHETMVDWVAKQSDSSYREILVNRLTYRAE